MKTAILMALSIVGSAQLAQQANKDIERDARGTCERIEVVHNLSAAQYVRISKAARKRNMTIEEYFSALFEMV